MSADFRNRQPSLPLSTRTEMAARRTTAPGGKHADPEPTREREGHACLPLPRRQLQTVVSLAGLLTPGHRRTLCAIRPAYSPRLLDPMGGSMALVRLSFPVTAAGPFRFLTGFPILSIAPSDRTPATVSQRIAPAGPASRKKHPPSTAGQSQVDNQRVRRAGRASRRRRWQWGNRKVDIQRLRPPFAPRRGWPRRGERPKPVSSRFSRHRPLAVIDPRKGTGKVVFPC